MIYRKRLEDAMEWLELSADNYTGTQSISWYIDHIGVLCKSMAFANGQMSEAKKELNLIKVKSYETLVTSSVANANYFAPSLAKDYISAKCVEAQYDYDLAERLSRTLVHTIEAIRSCMSALKEEMKIESYAGQGQRINH